TRATTPSRPDADRRRAAERRRRGTAPADSALDAPRDRARPEATPAPSSDPGPCAARSRLPTSPDDATQRSPPRPPVTASPPVLLASTAKHLDAEEDPGHHARRPASPPRLRLSYEAGRPTVTLGNSNEQIRGVWRERGHCTSPLLWMSWELASASSRSAPTAPATPRLRAGRRGSAGHGSLGSRALAATASGWRASFAAAVTRSSRSTVETVAADAPTASPTPSMQRPPPVLCSPAKRVPCPRARTARAR